MRADLSLKRHNTSRMDVVVDGETSDRREFQRMGRRGCFPPHLLFPSSGAIRGQWEEVVLEVVSSAAGSVAQVGSRAMLQQRLGKALA